VHGRLKSCPCLCIPLSEDFAAFDIMLTPKPVLEPKRDTFFARGHRRLSALQSRQLPRINVPVEDSIAEHEDRKLGGNPSSRLDSVMRTWAEWWTPPRVRYEPERSFSARSLSDEAITESMKVTRLYVLFVDGEQSFKRARSMVDGAMDQLRESLSAYYLGYLKEHTAVRVEQEEDEVVRNYYNENDVGAKNPDERPSYISDDTRDSRPGRTIYGILPNDDDGGISPGPEIAIDNGGISSDPEIAINDGGISPDPKITI